MKHAQDFLFVCMDPPSLPLQTENMGWWPNSTLQVTTQPATSNFYCQLLFPLECASTLQVEKSERACKIGHELGLM